MKIALSWLKNYLELGESSAEISDLLTFLGIEVEETLELEPLPETVIAAQVLSAERVAKTDHLRLCKVDIGAVEYPDKAEDNTIQVICGAPNCASGMMAALALPGTKLKEFEIKVAKIRGITSHGMLCSEQELGLSENHAGIIELPPDTPIGFSINELYALPDTIFAVEITPNRSDLLAYIGVARDLGAKLARPLNKPVLKALPKPTGDLSLGLKIKEPELCPRYTARVFKNVKVKESPVWLKNALIKSGLRPINNIVDITNFVMLEYGHPLHAFNYDALASESGNRPDIIVRKAHSGEKILALDGREYALSGRELVIADGKKASAIAGVMGSEYSGITEATQNIVLEAAAFHPGSVRKTSYDLKLSSDSSYRFERHLSAESVLELSHRATELILELAGGELCGELLDAYPGQQKPQYLGLRPARFEHLIGYALSADEMRKYLEALDFEYVQAAKYQKGLLNLADLENLASAAAGDADYAYYHRVPHYRKDISREADLLEELARLAGYERIPALEQRSQVMDRFAYQLHKRIMDHFVAWGAYEALNYSFADPARMQDLGYDAAKLPFIRLKNPQSSVHSVMRLSLLPHLLENLAYNLNHKERNIKLFEQAKVYIKTDAGSEEPLELTAVFTGLDAPDHWQHKAKAIDMFWVKGLVEGLWERLRLECQISFYAKPYYVENEAFVYKTNGVELGCFGRIKPSVLEKWDIDQNVLKQEVWALELKVERITAAARGISTRYQPISRFPAVQRDLSFLAPEGLQYAEIRQTILELNPEIIRAVQIFDEYRPKLITDAFRSLSLRIKLQEKEKTLTDEAVEDLMLQVQETLIEKYAIKMR